METNIREVSFSNSYTEHLYGFTQYDRGQKLKITGIETDANTEVHFALSASGGESPRVLPDSTGAETIVSVPDFVFCADRMYDYEAYAYVCYSDVNVGKTERRIIMHIKSRPKPADFAPPSEPDLTQKVLQELSTKLTAPSTAQIGQIFRVQSITEDGNLVLEAVDMPSGGSGGAVDDVQINGKSIVGENGVANIPIANNTTLGVISPSSNYGTQVIGSTIAPLNWTTYVDNRQSAFMTYRNLDYGVKQAMCDGKGEAWTADEQAAARARMGIGNFELIEEIVIEESIAKFARDTEPDGTPYDFKGIYIQLYSPNTNGVHGGRFYFYDDLNTNLFSPTVSYTNGNDYMSLGICELIGFGLQIPFFTNMARANNESTMYITQLTQLNKHINRIEFKIPKNEAVLMKDDVIKIYGMRW